MRHVASFRLVALASRARSAGTVATASRLRLAVNKPSAVSLSSARWYSSSNKLKYADIELKIMNILHRFVSPDQTMLTPVSAFSRDLGLDRVDIDEVVMAIEKEFSVEIPEGDFEKIHSIRDAVGYIAKLKDVVQ
ncbi:acyl carrier protein [Coemansia spiralis]|nr:acyl carrier protein [Coemansia spiralis]